jgi:dTMP kinase
MRTKTKKNIFIAIEGLDGVGKTTCAQLLAKKIKGVYYKTPSGIFQKMKRKIEALENKEVRFAFYLSSIFFASNEIERLLNEKSVVCDRYLFSTIAYHKALGVDLSFIDFQKLPIMMPDLSFYLYAEEKTLIERIIKRRQYSVSDIKLEKNRELQRKIHEEFLLLPVIRIDTTHLDPDEVTNKIYSLIKKAHFKMCFFIKIRIPVEIYVRRLNIQKYLYLLHHHEKRMNKLIYTFSLRILGMVLKRQRYHYLLDFFLLQ